MQGPAFRRVNLAQTLAAHHHRWHDLLPRDILYRHDLYSSAYKHENESAISSKLRLAFLSWEIIMDKINFANPHHTLSRTPAGALVYPIMHTDRDHAHWHRQRLLHPMAPLSDAHGNNKKTILHMMHSYKNMPPCKRNNMPARAAAIPPQPFNN